LADDLIERTTRELKERIAALESAVEELPRLKAALAALEGDASPPTPGRRGPGRPRRSNGNGNGSSGGGSPRRRRPRGANREAIMAVIQSRPGVSVGEVANVVAKEGVGKATTYTTVNKLTKDGLITKTDGGLQVVGADAAG
jgi:hypothetical protein